MADQELKIHAGLEGGEQTAAGLQRITEEQKKLAEATLQNAEANQDAKGEAQRIVDQYNVQGQATEKATTSQRGLNQTLSALARVAGDIHPELGALVGDLASIVRTSRDASGGLSAFGSVLKNIFSGGIATLGFAALTKSIAEARAEAEKLRGELEKLKEI